MTPNLPPVEFATTSAPFAKQTGKCGDLTKDAAAIHVCWEDADHQGDHKCAGCDHCWARQQQVMVA